MKIIVTGGAGFIGSALVRYIIQHTEHEVLTIDKLTYAANLDAISPALNNSRHSLVCADICNKARMIEIIQEYKPKWILHLAAESHVDRSIDGSADFIHTNILGTHSLLEAARTFYQNLPQEQKQTFRFLHVSTDEVFGSLGATGFFSETSPYNPHSPYSASKASSDHLARSWFDTYGLPTLVTNCSNNFGPFQYAEKLLPLTIFRAIHQQPIQVYGNGQNIRDWLHVDDHVRAILLVAEKGRVGETYNIGAHNERSNIDLVDAICSYLDRVQPKPNNQSYSQQISFVKDRPGHDFRYAIDSSKISRELGWKPLNSFTFDLEQTISWYTKNTWWYKDERINQRIGLAQSADMLEKSSNYEVAS